MSDVVVEAGGVVVLERNPTDEPVDGLSVDSVLEMELIGEEGGVCDSVGGLRGVGRT